MNKNAPKTPNDPNKFVERRNKKDWVVRSVNIIAVIGWICAIVAFTLVDRAKPATENMITRILNLSVVGYWNITMLRVSFIAIALSFLVCVIGFFINMTRHRRKTDRYNKPILVLGIISLITIIFFVIQYRHLIF